MTTTIFARFLLVLLLIVGMVACDSNNTPTADDAQTDAPETATENIVAAGKNDPVAPVQKPIELVVYSGRKEDFVEPVLEAFTKETGIQVELYSGNAAQLLAKLEIEGQRTPADLFLSNEVGTLQVGAEKALFSPLPANVVAEIPNRYVGQNNQWVGLSARLRTLVVNTTLVAEDEIFSILNLTGSDRAGQIAVTSAANGSFIGGATMYLGDLQEEGLLDWLRGLKLNAQGQAYAKHSMVVSDVAAGDRVVGLVNHYYILRHLDKNPDAPIKMVVPDQDDFAMGVAFNASGIAQVKSSDNAEAAQQLIAYLLSAAGQQQFAEVNREYPVLPGVAAPGLPPLNSLKLSSTPLGELGAKRELTLEVIEKSGLP